MLEHGPQGADHATSASSRSRRYFDRHGGKTILIGRFIGLVRALAPFIAGSSGMRYRAFVPYSVLGTGLWAAAFCLLGYFALGKPRPGDADRRQGGAGLRRRGRRSSVGGGGDLAVPARAGEPRRGWRRGSSATPGCGGCCPELRFTWDRLTPGGLGLEFTTLIAALAVSLFVLVGYALIVSGDAGPTPGDSQAIDVVDTLRSGWLTDVAKVVTALGSTAC